MHRPPRPASATQRVPVASMNKPRGLSRWSATTTVGRPEASPPAAPAPEIMPAAAHAAVAVAPARAATRRPLGTRAWPCTRHGRFIPMADAIRLRDGSAGAISSRHLEEERVWRGGGDGRGVARGSVLRGGPDGIEVRVREPLLGGVRAANPPLPRRRRLQRVPRLGEEARGDAVLLQAHGA